MVGFASPVRAEVLRQRPLHSAREDAHAKEMSRECRKTKVTHLLSTTPLTWPVCARCRDRSSSWSAKGDPSCSPRTASG